MSIVDDYTTPIVRERASCSVRYNVGSDSYRYDCNGYLFNATHACIDEFLTTHGFSASDHFVDFVSTQPAGENIELRLVITKYVDGAGVAAYEMQWETV